MGRKFKCEALHGDISQNQRERTLSGFRDGNFNVLVATDVAARGLDIPNVDLVIHYELPNTSEIFVHRSGRTGRAGKKGSAILIYTEKQARDVKVIEKDVGSRFTELPRIAVEGGSGDMFGDMGGGGRFGSYGSMGGGRPGNSGFGRSGGYGGSGFGRSGGGYGGSGFGRSGGGYSGSSSGRMGGYGESGSDRFGSFGGRSGGGGFGRSSSSHSDFSSGHSGGFGDTRSSQTSSDFVQSFPNLFGGFGGGKD